MMKFYANLFALTAEYISEKSIRRLRWLTIGSLPTLPMTAFLVLFGLPKGYLAIPFMIAFVACFVMMTSVLLARIVNRVWSPDKYLDEWEKDLKRRSMTMAFMVVIYVSIGMGIAWGLLDNVVAPYVAENPETLPILLLVSIIGAGFYTQIFTQLSLIVPIDEDELEKPQYVVTSARSILGIVALVTVVILSSAMMSGYYFGHRNHVIEHAAAQAACGDLDVDKHKKTKTKTETEAETQTETSIEVTCKGSEAIIHLDPETLKPI